jgi:hypothetical protein
MNFNDDPIAEEPMTAVVQLRVSLGEPQAELLQQRISMLPFKVSYREEQHDRELIGVISCTPAQEKIIRALLLDMGNSE